jgi:hypothetical protein
MDAFPLDAFFEWIQRVIEKRWGKVWAWSVFSVLLLLFIGGAIWFIFRH